VRRAMAFGALFIAAVYLHRHDFAVRTWPGGGAVCLAPYGCKVIVVQTVIRAFRAGAGIDATPAGPPETDDDNSTIEI
jgi:hypothetical protein